MRWHKSTPIETDDEAEKGERTMRGKYKRICEEACKAISGWGQFSDSPDTLVAAINKATNDSHNKDIRAEELAKELKLLKCEIEAAKVVVLRYEDGSVSVTDSRGDEAVSYQFGNMAHALVAASSDADIQRAIWSAFGWSAPAAIDGVYRYVHSCGWEFRFERNEATHEIPPPPEVCPRCFAVVEDEDDETEEEDTK